VTFTSADLHILARTIFGEARGQDFEGQIAVAWVVRNRVARPRRFAPTVAGVCLSPMQFSCWNRADPTFERMVMVEIPDPAYVTALAAAGMVLTDRAPDPTGGADHYHATYVQPYWARTMTRTVQLGAHVFYKE
jgi:spore germination cell wall hydrolase CwlJ-like protein